MPKKRSLMAFEERFVLNGKVLVLMGVSEVTNGKVFVLNGKDEVTNGKVEGLTFKI